MRKYRLASVLVFFAFQFFLLAAKAQDITTDKVTLGLKDDSLQTAIKKIEEQSAFRFFYRDTDVKQVTHLNLKSNTRTIAQTLSILLQNTNLCFKQMDNHILLEHKEVLTSCRINGTVVTAIDKMPLANVSVFLSNATIGARTAADGSFSLSGIRPGKYELVISIVGFETVRQPIDADSKSIIVPPVIMSPQTILLNEVAVNYRKDPYRERNYAWFRDEFIGTSNLAHDCKILNPEMLDLDFNADANILTASSVDFLQIDNYALGYKIKYLLTNFDKDITNTGSNDIEFGGPAFFQEMRGTAAQEKRWEKRRREVYEGSVMHFLRSVLNNSYAEDGFRVLRIMHLPNPARPTDSLINKKVKFYRSLGSKGRAYKDSLAYWRSKQLLPATIDKLLPDPVKQEDLVRITNQKGLFALAGDKCSFYIQYNKAHHYPSRISTRNLNEPGNNSRTIVNFAAPYVLFDKNGCVMDPSCLSFEGAWAKSRVADMLPVDYDPVWTDAAPEGQAPSNVQETYTAPVDQHEIKPELIKIKKYADSVANGRSSEKPYLQLDKPGYVQGDTIWFKGYLVDAASLTASDRSRIMYVDIANDSSRIVKSYSFPVAGGLTWGNISLDEKTFPAGNYTIRAYTNWMRNFGSDFFFTKSFFIADRAEDHWLVNKQITAGDAAAKIQLQFTDLNKLPVANTAINTQVFDGNKRLFKQVMQSDKDGVVSFSEPMPQKSSALKVIAQNKNGDKKAVIPIRLNRYANADVQFLPEGGALVSGLPAHVGVKAVGEDGKGINVTGEIYDSDQNLVAEFKSIHNGMGSFNLLVESEGRYIAKVYLPDGTMKQFQLPAVRSSGTVLLIKNLHGNDSLTVSVGATNNIVRSGQEYYLIAAARGVVCYASVISFENSGFISGRIAKSLFPTGLVDITLMTPDRRPVNERLVFVDHHDAINIMVTPDKARYHPRDSIALKINAVGSSGSPLQGNFSLAVTDDGSVNPRLINDDDIYSHLLLTSFIRGYIENPDYYFSPENTDRYTALDNLLLTQAWVGYDWDEIFNPLPLHYAAEREFTVSGNVRNAFNKPLKGTQVTLFSKSPLILMDTVTDNNGSFLFNGFPKVDTPLFLIKAVNKHGRSFNVGVTVNQITPPAFTTPELPGREPWFVNSDSLLVEQIKNDKIYGQNEDINMAGNVLKEVKISASKVIKGSENLNGSGNADVVLDEKDMENAGKKTFLQLLEENVKGFHESYIPGTSVEWYFIDEKWVIIVVDGIRLWSIYPGFNFIDLKNYLESHTAEDVKGIEVMHSSRYAWTYWRVFYPGPDPEAFAFVEITTRGGHGPVIGNTPGMYLYKPLPLSWPKQFYKPRYTVSDTAANKIADLRTTIDWEPNVNTDEKGEATVSFFAAGRKSTYTYIIEGTDLNGNFGYKTGQVIIDDGNHSAAGNTASR
jgi:hypothetical protein